MNDKYLDTDEAKEKYFLISYQWDDSSGKPVVSNDVWEGSIAQWMIMSVEQKQRWRLLFAMPITADEYNMLKGNI